MKGVGVGIRREELSQFVETVYTHYRCHGRSLPWRETSDPYSILVSEIMLQQTQVDRVREKYIAFLAVFPDFAALAGAGLSEVLSLWQGLGYNRRALALHRCAGEVVRRWEGNLPADLDALQSLPGIGPYTARAVAAFAFGLPAPFIETNIRTVFLHHFFGDREGVKDSEILPLVEQALDRDHPRDWYYALMDYGAMLKKAHGNPSRKSAHYCRQSPFRGSNRERRSHILQNILAAPGVTAAELARLLGVETASLRANLLQLEREGFIEERRGRFTVR